MIGEGGIRVEWRPFPRIGFELNCDSDFTPNGPLTGKMQLEALDNQDINFEVFVTGFNKYSKDSKIHLLLSGDLIQPTTIPKSPIDCSELRFHLINFESNFGRLRLENQRFYIIVDFLSDAADLIKEMKKFDGYSITHAGSAKICNDNMRYEDAENLLDALYYYLAFLSGFWCGPVLSLGFLDGIKKWEKWDIVTNEWYANVIDPIRIERSTPISSFRDKVRLTTWHSQWIWSKFADNSSLNQVFNGFMAKWEDESWKDYLKTAIFLYVEATQAAGGTEGAIVLAQAALELLASLHSVHHLKGKPCKNIFEQIHADERIRWLLEDLCIPTEIDSKVHPDLEDLRNHCSSALKNEPHKDGPKAITLVRNAIIHPYIKKVDNILSKTDDKVKLEILDLAI